MKNLTIAIGVAILLAGCYAMETIEGEPSGCRPECDDGDPCTEDFCDTEDYCHNVPIPGCGVDCTSDADCDDGIDCTVDYCDVAGICQHVDLCVEECDPDIHGINLLEAVGSIEAASNGEQIILVSSGPGAGESGRIDIFDPNHPPTDMLPLQRIDEGYEVRKPFVFWNEGEDPRLFWTRAESDFSSAMTGRFLPSEARLVDVNPAIELTDSKIHLNDVARNEDGQYGFGWQIRHPDIVHAFFSLYRIGEGMLETRQILAEHNQDPVVAATNEGWAIGVSSRDDGRPITNRVYLSQFRPPADPTMEEIVASFYYTDTLAAVNNQHHEMIIYQQDHDEGRLLSVGWLNEDGTAVRTQITRNAQGISTLGSYHEDQSLVSWCQISPDSGASSVQVFRIGATAELTPVFSVGLPCAKTELLRVGDDDYLIWITEAGGIAYLKNLSCLE